MSERPMTHGPALDTGASREWRVPTFRLAVPRGWSDRSLYCMSAPVANGAHITLNVATSEVEGDLELSVFAEDQVRQLAGQLDEFEILRSDKRLIGTRGVHRVEFSWKSPVGTVLRQTQWYLKRGTTAFTLTATAPPELYEQHESQFEELVAAFTPLG